MTTNEELIADAATEQVRADSEWRDGTIIAQLAKAEAERAAAARALEDAAAERVRLYGEPNSTAVWLRARAAEIREGKS